MESAKYFNNKFLIQLENINNVNKIILKTYV